LIDSQAASDSPHNPIFSKGEIPMASLPITILALALTAQAAPTNDTSRDRTTNVNQDQKFVEMAVTSGMAEVKLGQLATKQAKSTEVKQFAQHMVEDHSKANKELAAIVEKKQLNVRREIGQAHSRLAERLSSLQGGAFDRAYMDQMVKDHEKAVRLFQDQAKNGSDPELRQFAEQTLPKLKEHLQMARKVAGQDKNGGQQRNRNQTKQD